MTEEKEIQTKDIKKEVVELRKKLQTMINQTKFCWVCGRTDVLRTDHHAIAQRIKNIVMNITVPVCENCNQVVHINDNMMGLIKKIIFK